jgi:hypothetical protein
MSVFGAEPSQKMPPELNVLTTLKPISLFVNLLPLHSATPNDRAAGRVDARREEVADQQPVDGDVRAAGDGEYLVRRARAVEIAVFTVSAG